MIEVRGKAVAISGASGAIGAAVADAFGKLGARIVLNSRSRHELCAAHTERLRAEGIEAVHVEADVSRRDGAQVLIDTTVDHYGSIDVLLNVAGATVGAGNFVEVAPEDWAAAFDNNFYSAVYCSQAAIPHMLVNGFGRIVNTTSVRGLWSGGRPNIMAYSSAKAAVVSLTSTLAKDVSPEILVNAVAPGFVYTPNYDATAPEQVDKFLNATLLKRFLTVEEAAEAYVFLTQTTSITGQVLNVDGGFTLKLE